ncbi:late competence development ComFB family protein [Vibrio sp. 404]|uniref:Late competence development ComFB family protein n=1 Tax=Vibrio marinisediminis TaxID=2758441 RepID=A0A7W2FTQ2_9VIBR|nr:late competence development ComFB family protein [Vibrio marinisediminis]MBA5764030.1 late competence development ComFB family protein [Vibrio marinisediminis]
MQISEDVHNYMENLVGQVLARPEYTEQFDNDQLADLACLALIQLKPVYIRHDIDFLSTLSEQRLMLLKEYAETAVSSAKGMILEDRRKNRQDEFPVIFTNPRFDEDAELEWFEKPILKQQIK